MDGVHHNSPFVTVCRVPPQVARIDHLNVVKRPIKVFHALDA